MIEIHFIVNPTSNNGKSNEYFDKIENFLKSSHIKHFVYKTEYKKHAIKLAEEISSLNRPVHIIAVGGDGTLNEVLNGIKNFENVYLSALPSGSGNDFTSNFDKISQTDPIVNIKRLIKQQATKVDFLIVNDKVRCINAIGAGIVPNVIMKYLSYKHFSQKTKYKLATISKCLFFSVHKIKYSLDDGKTWVENKIISFSIGNGKNVGGGINLIPDGIVDDGFITVSLIHKFNRLFTIHNLIKLNKKGAGSIKYNERFKCEKILVKLDKKLYDIDGELYDDTDELSVRVVHNTLKFIV